MRPESDLRHGFGIEIAEVIDVADPESLNRVKVQFLMQGPDSAAWAPVATGFTGDNAGAFLIPDVGTRVVVSFRGGDPRYPVVLGAIWDGSTASPEQLGGSGDSVDRWSFTGKAGTRIAMIEESGNSQITLETPGGNKIEIDDQAGSVKLTQSGGSTITMDSGGIKMQSHTVEIEASSFRLTSVSTNFDTPMANFSAFVACQLVQSTTVISSTYTPGAGNML